MSWPLSMTRTNPAAMPPKNNRNNEISGPTRLRVHAAIDQLGFVRNESARHLRAGSSRTIGLVVLDIANPFFTDVARGVEDVANAEGLAVILCNSDDRPAKEAAHLDGCPACREEYDSLRLLALQSDEPTG